MTDNKTYTVYKHVSPSGKIYIGQTCQVVNKRWGRGSGYKAHPHFYNAIKKYGWDNFEHVIIADSLTKKEADYLEKYLIAYYETMNPLKGYNLTKGGEGTSGKVVSEETKKKIGDANRGKTHVGIKRPDSSELLKRNNPMKNPEIAAKVSRLFKGHSVSEETRRKMSESHKKLNRPRDAKGHYIKSA